VSADDAAFKERATLISGDSLEWLIGMDERAREVGRPVRKCEVCQDPMADHAWVRLNPQGDVVECSNRIRLSPSQSVITAVLLVAFVVVAFSFIPAPG
jgi:hypothetical protein